MDRFSSLRRTIEGYTSLGFIDWIVDVREYGPSKHDLCLWLLGPGVRDRRLLERFVNKSKDKLSLKASFADEVADLELRFVEYPKREGMPTYLIVEPVGHGNGNIVHWELWVKSNDESN